MQILLALITVIAATGGTVLPPCPASPNCVSSQAEDGHFIEPFSMNGETKFTFNRLLTILEDRNDTKIIADDDRMIRVEFRTRLGFVDDGLFVLDRENKAIQIRSAARSGYWDLGKNRRRLEEIRRQFRETSR